MYPSSNINLGVSWQGPYTFAKGRDFECVDVSINGTYVCSAPINTNLPSREEQHLRLRVSKQGASQEGQSIKCPIELVKSISVYAKIIRTTLCDSDDDGFAPTIDFWHYPVFIVKFPEFQPNGTYQIRILNRGIDSLLKGAIVKEGSEKDATQELSPQEECVII